MSAPSSIPPARAIEIKGGFIAFVDECDFAFLSTRSWYVRTCGKGERQLRYAQASFSNKVMRMHRIIMGAQRGDVIDHIDGDGLNNRRGNLRFCTVRENLGNARAHIDGTSKYRGVYLSERGNCWRVVIDRKDRGTFKSEIEAAHAADAAAVAVFGRFARLNFGASEL